MSEPSATAKRAGEAGVFAVRFASVLVELRRAKQAGSGVVLSASEVEALMEGIGLMVAERKQR